MAYASRLCCISSIDAAPTAASRTSTITNSRCSTDAILEEAGFTLVRDGKLDKTLGHAALGLEPLTGGAYAELDPGIDPYAFVVSRNIHRRHLNAKQRRELIAKLIKADPSKSDRQIGETIKADHKTVGAVRAEKEATGEISPVEKRVGKDRKARKQPVKKATTAKSPRAAQAKATEAQETKAARKPKPRDDIGPGSTSELARLRARVDALQSEKHRLQMENLALRNEVEELKQRLANATGKAAPVADDGLDIPESLRRSSGAAHG